MANKFKTAINVSVDTSQLNDLIQRLADVDKRAARKAMKQGVNEVTKLVLAEVKSLVPTNTGMLKKSLGRFVKVGDGGRSVLGVVKPRAGVWMADAPGLVGRRMTRNGKTRVFVQKFKLTPQGPLARVVNPVRYAHLVEFGRVAVTVKKKKVLSGGGVVYGRKVAAMAPRPFMRPAWDKYQGQATAIVAKYLSQAMLAFWKKRGR